MTQIIGFSGGEAAKADLWGNIYIYIKQNSSLETYSFVCAPGSFDPLKLLRRRFHCELRGHLAAVPPVGIAPNAFRCAAAVVFAKSHHLPPRSDLAFYFAAMNDMCLGTSDSMRLFYFTLRLACANN